MTDVYENCPVFENDNYILRMTSQEDKSDLLKVYSDKAAVPFLTVIIAAVTTFIIQRKAEWSRRLHIGSLSTIGQVLSDGRLYQKKPMRQ